MFREKLAQMAGGSRVAAVAIGELLDRVAAGVTEHRAERMDMADSTGHRNTS